jgi:type II secretory pathway component PulC
MEIKSRVQLRWRLAAACAVLLWFAGLVSLAIDDYNVTHDDFKISEDTPLSPMDSSPDSRSSSELSSSKLFNSELSNSLKSNHRLNNLYLMGRPKPVPEKVVEVEPLTETRLDFVLRGVFASQGSQLGGAVIDIGSKEPGFFQIGDLIAEDITLAAVQDDGVVIDRAGMREKLSFDKSLVDIDTFVRSRNSDFSSAEADEEDLSAELSIDLSTEPKREKRQLSLTERLKILRSN